MQRPVLRLILDVVLTILGALVLLWLWQWFLGGDVVDAIGESLRVMFNFMDVGLAVWVVLAIVFLVRLRSLSAARTYVLLVLAVILNVIVVTVIGFIQGGWAALLVLFAIEAGLACLIVAAMVVPLVHRRVK